MLLNVLKDLIRARRAPSDDDALRTARELCDRSQHKEAIAILDALIHRRPDGVQALRLRGAARRSSGRLQESLADLSRAARLAPDDAMCLYELALTSHALGDNDRALECCRRSREIDPAFAEARFLQAQIVLGGEYYFAVLERLHAHLRPRTYVEIGVFKGQSLRLATAPTRAIAIDPSPQLTYTPATNQRVYAQTSDAFFANRDLRSELDGLPVDLGFIDGMHHFEYALRDFANLERHCTRNSTLLIHDCYPLDRYTARRDGAPPFWSGDVWRLIVLLKRHRPDLAVHTIGAPPTGLGLVRNLDPESRFLSENHERLCEEFLALDYAYLDDDKAGKLNLVPNQWDRIRTLLG